MAISKNRLEELIKEGATIWAIGRYSFQDKIEEIKLDKDFFSVSKNALIYPDLFYTKLEDLFETKKQAEWALKYHATRTEELNLPMWKEIKDIKNIKTIVSFYAKNKETDTVYMDIHAKHLIVETEYKEFLNTEFTEENYIKACDLCLKLFKGEEK